MHRFNRGNSPVDFKKVSRKYKTGKRWEDFVQNEKDSYFAIRGALYERQRRRCAYCESKIDDDGRFDGHIEHLERRADVPSRTFDWDNLFLSCNSPGSCGKFKDALKGEKRKFCVDEIVDPSKENPLKYFNFSWKGNIVPVGKATPEMKRKVEETVRIFNLNDPKLSGMRAVAYRNATDFLETTPTDEEIEEYLKMLPDEEPCISVYYAVFQEEDAYEARFASTTGTY